MQAPFCFLGGERRGERTDDGRPCGSVGVPPPTELKDARRGEGTASQNKKGWRKKGWHKKGWHKKG